MEKEVESEIPAVASDREDSESRELTEKPQEDTAEDEEPEDTGFECSRAYFTRLFCNLNIYNQAFILFALVMTYILVGGAIFLAFELPAETKRNEAITAANETYIRAFNNIVDQLVNFTNLTEEEAMALVRRVAQSAIDASNNQPTNNWEYGSAIFFATTVITTIGYGSIAPETDGGRGFFIPYALVGIPLTLIFLGFLGQVLNKGVDRATRCLRRRVTFDWGQILVVFTIGLVSFIFIPAIIFAIIDDWTYFEAVYFTFVSLTTVGFGDFVPTAPKTFRGLYRFSLICWLFLGLAFIALIIAQTQERIENVRESVKKCRKCIKRTGGKLMLRKKNKESSKDNEKTEETEVEKE
ncbi:potassium channel subfamily K member 16-like [Amphimedon queenslandica]|uniref:Tandem pore domain potassium channel n=1 Tax=Amphimedon queenslandica TaxID=400682 RepID=I3PB64_AMPQE|nr:potassium channel subfamily K member 16-like [Amphimedon queenslandica]AEO79974.1 tandem pore domain potassium channel [Amphimedon queenslandica]|eukprot:NP_001295560.1 potassium channel subfamily K member 16-like [Amphimedon queenslandica]